jgi:hypothetical protein
MEQPENQQAASARMKIGKSSLLLSANLIHTLLVTNLMN